MPATLPVSDVHVWWSPSGDAPPHAIEALIDLERVRHARFRFDEDRQSYLAAHAMLRLLLAHYGSDAARAVFKEGKHGKPLIDDGPELNLSHTRGLVACVFSASLAVGVDVESIHRTNDWRRLMPSVLCAPEIEDIDARPAHEQQARFYEFWTLKEAWSKASGLGLHANFPTMNALAVPRDVTLALHDAPEGFRLAVAALGVPSRVVLRRFEWSQHPLG